MASELNKGGGPSPNSAGATESRLFQRLDKLIEGHSKKADNAGRFNELVFAEKLLKQMPPLKTVGKEWFVYEIGAWLSRCRDEFAPLARMACPQRHRTARAIKNLLDHLELARQVPKSEFCGFHKLINEPDGSESILINATNCVLRLWPEGVVTAQKHDAAHGFTSRTSASYQENSQCPLFQSVLAAALPDEADRNLLQMYCGNILLPSNRFETCLIAYGKGGTGKSTIMEAIADALDDGTLENDLVTCLSMRTICDSKGYSLPKLRFAALNIGTEIDTLDVEESTNFKLAVSGEKMEARPIYGSPFSMRSSCKHLFCSNSVPRFKNGTGGELRRLRFLHFDVEPAEKDTNLKQKLKAERDGIFYWMIEGLIKLQALPEGGKIPEGSTKSQAVLERFSINNDPIAYFVKAHCILDSNSRVNKEELKAEFARFTENNGLPHDMKAEWFFRGLYQRNPELKPCDEWINRASGERAYFVKGLRIRSDTEGAS